MLWRGPKINVRSADLRDDNVIKLTEEGEPAMLTAFIAVFIIQSVPPSSGIPKSAPCPNGRSECCPWEREWWHDNPEAALKDGDTVEIAGLMHVRRSGGWFPQSSANPFEDLTARSGPGRHELVARVAGSPYRRVYATGRGCHRARSAIVASTRQAEAEAQARGIILGGGSAPVCIPLD